MWGACMGQTLPGVETCVSTEDEDCDNKECARWSIISEGAAIVSAIAADSDGNVLITGLFGGTVSFGDQTIDETTNGKLFLVKLDSTGKALWAKSFGGLELTKGGPRSLASDKDGNILIFGFCEGKVSAPGWSHTCLEQDIFAAKFTKSGALAWLKGYGGDTDQAAANMVLTDVGDMLVTGTYDTKVQLGGTANFVPGAYVARLSGSNGDVLSVKTFDTEVGEYVNPRVGAGPDGTWILSGRCGDGAFLGGMTLNPCANFVSLFGADDSPIWLVQVPENPTAMSVAGDGSVMIAGYFSTSIDFGMGATPSAGQWDGFAAKLAFADGSVQWAKTFGGAEDDVVTDIVVDSENRPYLSITSEGSIDFGRGPLSSSGLQDYFVVALDGDGAHRWSRVFGDATLQVAGPMALRSGSEGLIVSLSTAGEVDFGAGVLTAAAQGSAAIAELGP
jgi:hypothetical protein